jgi:hypothetical protein
VEGADVDVHHLARSQRTLATETRRERLSVEQLHDEVEATIAHPTEVEDLDDVLMLNPSCVLRFAEKATGDVVIERDPVDRSNELHRHGALHHQVDAAVDDAHTPVAEGVFEAIAPAQQPWEVVVLGHRSAS